jgi:hypothetical protein
MIICYTIILASCCKAKPDLVSSNIINSTVFTISITPYSGGKPFDDFKRVLKPNVKIENVFNCASGDCFNKKVTIDSLLVSYDGLLFENNRNLLSLSNFNVDRFKVSKCNYETNYSFTFTQQDYLDAK